MNLIRLTITGLNIIALFACFFAHHCCAEMIVSLRSPETKSDRREEYNFELISLALERTKTEYGDYKIVKIPPMNTARSFYTLKEDTYPNLLIELTYQQKLEQELDLIYVNFPLELGIVGYRVCFASPGTYPKLKSVRTLEDLKQFTIGQGVAWADTEILRYNGLKVVEISSFNSLFSMVEHGRIDLFCRGANELQPEYNALKDAGNLLYDETFVLHYSLPRFYYLNKKNKLARERIEKGLAAAYQDGSVNALWEKHFLASVNFVKLKQRREFKLENPFMNSLHEHYEKYFYDPMK